MLVLNTLPEQRSLQSLGIFFLLLACIWIGIGAYAIHAALPFNTITLPFERWAHIRFFTPEGWGFFTRDPREERLLLFAKHDGRWSSASVGPNGNASNLFGLNRAPRSQGLEASILISKTGPKDIVDCHDKPETCLLHDSTVISLDNLYPHPTLCGSIGMVMQKPIPWAWSRAKQLIIMPSRVLRINVRCK